MQGYLESGLDLAGAVVRISRNRWLSRPVDSARTAADENLGRG